MSDACGTSSGTSPIKFDLNKVLRAEAAIDPDPVPTGEATKTTQIIAIYGKAASARASRSPT